LAGTAVTDWENSEVAEEKSDKRLVRLAGHSKTVWSSLQRLRVPCQPVISAVPILFGVMPGEPYHAAGDQIGYNNAHLVVIARALRDSLNYVPQSHPATQMTFH
jgi:hypothetical protein